jgi:hypothetical protein
VKTLNLIYDDGAQTKGGPTCSTSARSPSGSADAPRSAGAPGVRSHGRLRNRGTEYASGSGVKWVRGGAKRRCDRALGAPRAAAASCSAAAAQKSRMAWSGRADDNATAAPPCILYIGNQW